MAVIERHREPLARVNGLDLELLHPNGFPYPIPLAELATPTGWNHWTRHLAEKCWVTPDHLAMMAELIEGAKGGGG